MTPPTSRPMDSGRSRAQLEAMPARIACTLPEIAWQRDVHLARLRSGKRAVMRYVAESPTSRRVVAVELHARRILGRPGGWTVELHCGSCFRPARTLYLAPLGGPACRRCVGATYRSNCTRGSIAWARVGRPAARAVRILARLPTLGLGRRALAELAKAQEAIAAASAGFAAIKAEPQLRAGAWGTPRVRLQTIARQRQAERAMRELEAALLRFHQDLGLPPGATHQDAPGTRIAEAGDH